MASERPPQINDDNRVVTFRSRKRSVGGLPREKSWNVRRTQDGSPVNDLGKYESLEPDDYRHRMTMNMATMGIAVVLIVMGIWFANAILHS